MADLVVPGRRGFTIPDVELVERFSRSSGPGGQSVNTTDSRVELRWDLAASTAVDDEARARLLERLGPRLSNGALLVVASEQRSQLQNRTAARGRLLNLLTEALAPPPPERRASRPSRRARARRVDAKRQRGELKATRRRPNPD